jgi:hypothetical protein
VDGGEPGNGKGKVVGIVMTGPTPELDGEGKGLGMLGRDGNGNGEVDSGDDAEGAALADADDEGWGFTPPEAAGA